MDETELVTVYRTGVPEECRVRSLVLTAAGIPAEVSEALPEWVLRVHAEDEVRAVEELEQYARENVEVSQPTRPLADSPHHKALPGVLGYALVLVLVDLLARGNAWSLDWWRAGSANAALIGQGEWWRTATALTLHVDLMHLAGNLVFGGLFGLLVGERLGAGLAWASILLAGSLGNTINALVQSPAHTSVGASTAVFAALGLLAFHTWQRWGHTRARVLHRYASIVCGVVLLAFLGMSGERTDFVAHITGFAVGGALGAAFGAWGTRVSIGALGQRVLGAGALAVLCVCWGLALANA